MADVELLPCGECGMPCRAGEYHPFAACLMFKACHNSETVRANLAPLQAEIEALRAEVAEWKRVAAAQAELHGEAEDRAERLAEALRRAHRWGGLGKGWDSGVALDLIAWIESGMHGELPPLPDYLAAALAQEDCNG